MAEENSALSFSVASVLEDVLNQSQTLDVDSRRAQESAMRRYEGAAWLRKMVGVVGAKDLPAEPSEDEFRLGLRSGLILCNVINKVQPGAVPKVVESSCDSSVVPEGAALSAYQYFENVRNFLVAVEQMGLPTFEASDLEQGGKSSRIVNCVLALKSYNEWKQMGGNGTWKFGGNLKASTPNKQLIRKNSDPFTNSVSRTNDNSKMHNSSLSTLVHAVLLDKKPDEVPILLESLLSKVMEEFEHRIASQVEMQKPSPKSSPSFNGNRTFVKHTSCDVKVEDKSPVMVMKDKSSRKNSVNDEELRRKQLRYQMVFDDQQEDIKALRQSLLTTKAGMQFMQRKFHEDIHNLGQHVLGLAHAASGYHRVLEENRKLYNQVQDLKGNIRVYCRVRPFIGRQSNFTSTVDSIEEGTISINTPSKYGKGRRSFNFNKVFGPSATQGEVFEDTRPLIRSVLDGYNVCIFAYGQTGSGKTHTMTGPKDLTEDNQGVNYRALNDLFFLAEQRKGTLQYDVSVQMIEIYNEQVRDLLKIRNNSQNGFNVPEASLMRVSSTYDVIDLMALGHKNRVVGATALNDRSSRSHSCLTVHVQGRDLTSGAVLRGCMHLVDLAGSERVDKSERTPLVHVKLTLDLGGQLMWVNCERGLTSSSISYPMCGSPQCQLLNAPSCIDLCYHIPSPLCTNNSCASMAINTIGPAATTPAPINGDVLKIQSTDGKGVTVPRFYFACGSDMTTDNSLASGVTGMAGLGRTVMSLPAQLSSYFKFNRKFTLCLSSSTTSSGVVFFGDVKSIKINNKHVSFDESLLSINAQGYGGTAISTTDPYTVLETSIYLALVEAFVKAMPKNVERVPFVPPFGACFSSKNIASTRRGPDVPIIDLVLQSNNIWRIFGANSMVRVNNDVLCLGFVERSSLTLLPIVSVKIGGHQIEDNLLKFDLKKSKLGFSSSLLGRSTSCANFNFTSPA
ncbi:kinesin-4 [Artemisia annua]|uniref:Kinesin-4 n=1 Tax=Artemisia annua TaxID=35608 RepID=A0A2U1MKG8_ARTAN|nr:kinesin-4 [Artemisia annua]